MIGQVVSNDGDCNSESSKDSEEGCELSNTAQKTSELERNLSEPTTFEDRSNSKIHWSKEPTFRDSFELTASPGVKINIEDNNPLSIFEEYVTKGLLELISVETNFYASQCIGSEDHSNPKRRSKYWNETSPSEIMLFIGFILLQRIIVLPNYGMYFSKRRIVSCPIF